MNLSSPQHQMIKKIADKKLQHIDTFSRLNPTLKALQRRGLVESRSHPESYMFRWGLTEEGRRYAKENIKKVATKKIKKCEWCSRTDVHSHCPECGDTNHTASECDMLG